MKTCDVSVVIPHYERPAFLKLALESVFKQSLMPSEIIIVDDGSRREFEKEAFSVFVYAQSQVDIAMKWIRLDKNRGVSSARNRGVDHASYDWLAFLDCDDQWLEKKMELQWQSHLEHLNYQLWHSDEIWIRSGIRVNAPKRFAKKGGHIFDDCLDFCKISPSTVLIAKDFFWQLGGWDESYVVCEDFDLWLKASSRQEIGLVPLPLVKKFGGHSDQLSARFADIAWRQVTALDRIKQWRDLPLKDRILVNIMIIKKCDSLLKSYKKYDNVEQERQTLEILHRALKEQKIFR